MQHALDEHGAVNGVHHHPRHELARLLVVGAGDELRLSRLRVDDHFALQEHRLPTRRPNLLEKLVGNFDTTFFGLMNLGEYLGNMLISSPQNANFLSVHQHPFFIFY